MTYTTTSVKWWRIHANQGHRVPHFRFSSHLRCVKCHFQAVVNSTGNKALAGSPFVQLLIVGVFHVSLKCRPVCTSTNTSPVVAPRPISRSSRAQSHVRCGGSTHVWLVVLSTHCKPCALHFSTPYSDDGDPTTRNRLPTQKQRTARTSTPCSRWKTSGLPIAKKQKRYGSRKNRGLNGGTPQVHWLTKIGTNHELQHHTEE